MTNIVQRLDAYYLIKRNTDSNIVYRRRRYCPSLTIYVILTKKTHGLQGITENFLHAVRSSTTKLIQILSQNAAGLRMTEFANGTLLYLTNTLSRDAQFTPDLFKRVVVVIDKAET